MDIYEHLPSLSMQRVVSGEGTNTRSVTSGLTKPEQSTLAGRKTARRSTSARQNAQHSRTASEITSCTVGGPWANLADYGGDSTRAARCNLDSQRIAPGCRCGRCNQLTAHCRCAYRLA